MVFPCHSTVVGIASVEVGSEIGVPDGATTCHGSRVGVFDAGASPSFIAAIGFG